jgi:hypothetical protein
MSLVAGSAVGIVNSAVWAVAVSYMARQRALVALARQQTPAAELEATEWPDALRAGERRGAAKR